MFLVCGRRYLVVDSEDNDKDFKKLEEKKVTRLEDLIVPIPQAIHFVQRKRPKMATSIKTKRKKKK